jgi:diguanylate cyclase (GGDEF)-like protein
MTDAQQSKFIELLLRIDKIIARKTTAKNLTASVKQEISKHTKSTRVFILIGSDKGEPKAKGGDQFARSFAGLVVKHKKAFIVNKELDKFCKKHGIMRGRKVAGSAFGVPLRYRSVVYGALVVNNTKEANAFKRVDQSLITTLAYRLGAEIAHDDMVEENVRLSEEVRELSLIDEVTKIPNRRYFDLVLGMEVKKAKGYSRQLSIALIDLDHFRSLSARYGKNTSDKILLHLAQTLKRNVRDTDFVARYGGGEFVILLPETMNEAAVNVAERVRNAVERAPLKAKGLRKKKMTISLGVVTYPSSAESLPVLIEQAQKALSRAKQLGRNQVVTI